jgi:hypothetical protein
MLGTAKHRQEAKAPSDAEELGGIVLKDVRGEEVRLGELWRDRPAVLVFLRHYG